jgi:hypothetical protein
LISYYKRVKVSSFFSKVHRSFWRHSEATTSA